MAVDPAGQRVVVGFAEPQLEVYEVADEQPGTSGRDVLQSLGSVSRATTDRVAGLEFSRDGRLLSCLGAGKALELFRYEIGPSPTGNSRTIPHY